jgi:hypothetical protein
VEGGETFSARATRCKQTRPTSCSSCCAVHMVDRFWGRADPELVVLAELMLLEILSHESVRPQTRRWGVTIDEACVAAIIPGFIAAAYPLPPPPGPPVNGGVGE